MDQEEEDLYYSDEEKQKEYWEEPKPHGDFGGRLRCDNCGSYNTNQSTYSDWCNSCGESQGY